MPLYDSWVGKICWRRDRLLTQVLLGFPCGSAGKESACNADRPGFDPWVVEDRDLHQEDPLEKGNATHSSILAWRSPGLYSPWGCKELEKTERLSLFVTREVDCNWFY